MRSVVHEEFDPSEVWSIRSLIHEESDPSGVWSMRSVVHEECDPSGVWSIRRTLVYRFFTLWVPSTQTFTVCYFLFYYSMSGSFRLKNRNQDGWKTSGCNRKKGSTKAVRPNAQGWKKCSKNWIWSMWLIEKPHDQKCRYVKNMQITHLKKFWFSRLVLIICNYLYFK